MKLGTLATAGLLGMGLAIAPVFAQGPLYDTVKVNLPYTVTVGEKTLPPGEYTIRQFNDSGTNSRILLIYSDSGMKFQTSAMTIPALDPNTARDTQVILDNFDNKYYMSKIWIQGKDYGYEFPLPRELKERSKEQVASVNVPGTYSSSKAEVESTTSANNSTPANTTTTTAEVNQTPATVTNQPSSATDNTMAQNTPPPPSSSPYDHDQMRPANPPVASTPTYSDNNTANREAADQQPATTDNTPATPKRMPSTSAGWLMMLLGGGSLSSLGMALRRKRQ